MKKFFSALWGLLKKVAARFSFNSPVILSFVLVSLLALVADMISGGWVNTHLTGVYRWRWSDPMTYVRLLLHPLGHAGWAHYAGNMALMLIVGPAAEEKHGSWRLLVMMLITALVTGLLHIAVSDGMMLGASGVVFMLMILSTITGPTEKGKIPLTLVLACAAYLGQEIAAGVTQADNIAQLAHVAGGLCGAVFGLLGAKSKAQ